MISPLKSFEGDIPFYNTFDFETTRAGLVNGAGLYFLKEELPVYEVFTSLDDFMEFIIEGSEVHKSLRTLWAHNGGRFDWLLVLEWLVKHPEIVWKAPKNSTGLVYLKIYPPKAAYKKGKQIKYKWIIYLYDSLQVLPRSLKELCKSFGVEVQKIDLGEKHPEDIYRDNPGLFWEYLKNDCVSLSQILGRAHKLINTITPIEKITPTLASVALRVFKSGFLKEMILTPKNKSQLELEQSAYHGGLVDCKEGQYVDKVYTYDINSQYPAAMRNLIVPTSYTGRWTDKYNGRLGIYRGYYHQPDNTGPALIFNIENKTAYSGEGVLTSLEIDYLLSIGGSFQCIEGFWYTQTGKLFQGYVDTIYGIRMDAKERGDETLTFICKILLNSLYGKFGQKPEGTTYQVVRNQEEYRRLVKDKTKSVDNLGNFLAITEELPVEHRFPAISAFITARARIMIHTAIMAHKENFYYCDTDCMHISEPLDEEFIGKGLGQFKLEYTGRVIYLGKKLYWKIDTDEITSKGIPLPSKKSSLPESTEKRNRVKKAFCDIIQGDAIDYKHHYSNSPTVIQVLIGNKKAAKWIDYERTMKCTASTIKYSSIPMDILQSIGNVSYDEDIFIHANKRDYEYREENPYRILLDALRENGYISSYKNGYRLAEYKSIPVFMRRKRGLRLDQMAEQLRQDHPELNIEDENGLLDKIRDYEIWRLNHPNL
jgi:hypothetical protein